MDERKPGSGSLVEGKDADFYENRVLCGFGGVFPRLVGAFAPFALLVFETGPNRRSALHTSDALLLGDWHFPVRHHADFWRDYVDDVAPASMVLNHVWRLLFRRVG